jgi:hypothetical protein
MLKKPFSWSPHTIAHLTLALTASVLFGILAGRVMGAVGKTTAFKQARADLVSFVTGRPAFDFRKNNRLATESYRNQGNH